MQKKGIFNVLLLGVALLLVGCTQSPPALPMETAPFPAPIIETNESVSSLPIPIESVTLDSERAVREQLRQVLRE